MPDTGFVFPSTAVGNRPITDSDLDWTTPSNVTADDTSVAEVGPLSFTQSRGLAATNFDFSSIPAGSIIDGIEIRVGDYVAPGGNTPWVVVRLILADDSDGSVNRFAELLGITTTEQTDEVGGAADLWSETINLADVQNSNWGFFVGCEHQGASARNVDVDFMQMKVYYTESAEAGPPDAWAVQTQRNSRKSGRYI
jgi:hypothetical protein